MKKLLLLLCLLLPIVGISIRINSINVFYSVFFHGYVNGNRRYRAEAIIKVIPVSVLIVVIARVSKRSTNSPETSDVPASLSIRVQGREYSIPTPDADKLTAWSGDTEHKAANRHETPDSAALYILRK